MTLGKGRAIGLIEIKITVAIAYINRGLVHLRTYHLRTMLLFLSYRFIVVYNRNIFNK